MGIEFRKHEMYYGRSIRGLMLIPFAKCRCGAHLVGAEAIAEHRRVMEAEN